MLFVLCSNLMFPSEMVLGGVLAQSGLASTVEISEAVNQWFRRSASLSENRFWGIIFLAIVALWVVLYLWDRSRKPRKPINQDRENLFHQLCDLHKLSKNDRQLLKGIAKSQRLDQPALAFVNPNILRNFAEKQPQATLEIRDLMDRLFGETLVKEIIGQSARDAK